MRSLYVVESNPIPGREDEFNRWYTEVHLAEVLAIPGILTAQRFELAASQMQPDQAHRYLAIYEIDGTDVDGVLDELRGAAGSLTMSDAMDMSSVQISVFNPLTGLVEADPGR